MRRQRSTTHPGASVPRMRPPVPESGSDTYGLRGKLTAPTACPACGAVYRGGRWTWGPPPADAHRTLCPACRRTEDGYPAGVVFVEGDFATSRREEIVALARHVEEREKQEHPLKRIMRVEEPERGRLEIATTDARLARGIGEALHHAYQGELEYDMADAETLLRVHWRR